MGAVAHAVGGRVVGDPAVVVRSVAQDSRRVTPGGLFCCIRGDHQDGHDHAAAAAGSGAAALLVEHELDLGLPQVVVPDTRAAVGPAAATVLGQPAERLATVGVTGTNGKTTVVTLVGHLAEACGRRTDVVGTLTGSRTTPEACELQERFAADVDAGVEVVALEVSSHALVLGRVDGIRFDVAAFTNLGVDHLDFHVTLEDYFAAKASLFTPQRCERAVVWVDDPWGRRLADGLVGAGGVPVVAVSFADAVDRSWDGAAWRWTWRGHPVVLDRPGEHDVANALVACEVLAALGADPAAIAGAVASAPAVPGRFERIDVRVAAEELPVVVVDFAHTPDALEQALLAARRLIAGTGRLVVVFGCGGDRDRSKRPQMGAVAARSADLAVVCDDNPRSEEPALIRQQVAAGVDAADRARLVEIGDRRAAIRHALRSTGQGDVVLIAGKGHETGQTTAGVTVPFDDRVVAEEELRARLDEERSS